MEQRTGGLGVEDERDVKGGPIQGEAVGQLAVIPQALAMVSDDEHAPGPSGVGFER